MKKKFKVFFTVMVFLTVLPLMSGQTIINVDLLENVRTDIVFPELTQAEKRLIAGQAELLLKELYVHRYQKTDYYGAAVDPVPAIAEVVRNVDSMTTAEMEEAIYRIFVEQRDLHLNYNFPAPYSKYTSFIPIRFMRVAGETNFFEVRVANRNAGEIEHYAPGQRVPDIGDELVSYDNLPVLDAVARQEATGQGTNRYGAFSRALSLLTYVRHKYHLLPESNEVTMTFRSHVSGELYTCTYPWIVEWEETIAPAVMDEESSEPRRYTLEDIYQATNYEQIEYQEFLARKKLNAKNIFPAQASDEPTIFWGILENAQGRFGYLSITSFVPEKGTNYALDQIIRIVTEKFADTKGLIIDVRGNGGGSITYADKLSQLFMPGTARAIHARLLNTPVNKFIFNNSIFQYMDKPEWKAVMNAAGPTDTYTATAPFTYAKDANLLGQIYYKPVIVLTNADSYSATDLFACAMQDNEAALIFGEDPQTGAGGANVMEHQFYVDVVKGPFVQLPKDHSMRVSWRQSVRFGKNDGKLIEDYGCTADFDASRTITDLINGGQQQIQLLTQYLNNLSGLQREAVVPANNEKMLYAAKDELQFSYKVINTNWVKVLVDGNLFQEINVNKPFGEEVIQVDLGTNWPVGSTINLTLEGYDHQGTLVWNTKKNLTILEARLVIDTTPVEIDFATATSPAPLTIINNRTQSADGWNLTSPYLQVGYNPVYKNNTDTDALLFLDLSQRTQIYFSFTAEYDTEPRYDNFDIFITVGNKRYNLLRKNGKGAMATYSYNMNLSALTERDNVVIHFQFKSDYIGTAPGVKISNISIR